MSHGSKIVGYTWNCKCFEIWASAQLVLVIFADQWCGFNSLNSASGVLFIKVKTRPVGGKPALLSLV